MNKYISILILVLMQSWGSNVLASRDSNVNVEVGAESVARVVLYYRGQPLNETGVDFPLPIDGISQRFERTSDFLYLVGNVDSAEVVFSDSSFELLSIRRRQEKMHLSGEFLQQGNYFNAQRPLQVPVLKNISEATVATGFKVRFKSEFVSGRYSQDTYTNVFTMVVTPKL